MTRQEEIEMDPVAIEDGEYMLAPVPESERRPAWKQVMVWVGFGML